MEIQTRVAPAELWLRDDLEEVYALLFRFLGYGFRLAAEELFVLGQALSLLMFRQDTSARSLSVFMCRRSETSTFGLCKAADVQRSGPGPGRRAHEAAQRQTQFLDHVLCVGNTMTSRRWRASSPSRSSPTLASLVKTRSRHTS